MKGGIIMDSRSIVNYYGAKVDLLVDLEDGQLKTHIHDRSGWIFDTENVVVAFSIIGDRKPSELGYADDTNKIVDIIDSKLPYDKELILNSLDDGGDLNWVYWLSGGNAYWMQGYDRDYIYDDIKDIYTEEYLTDEDENEDGYTDAYYNNIDRVYSKVMETYHEDKIQEQIRIDHEGDLMDIINSSSTWNEFYTNLHVLEQVIQNFLYEYLTEFIYSCNAL